MIVTQDNYYTFKIDKNTTQVTIPDHLGGFDQALLSPVLNHLIDQIKDRSITVKTGYIVDDDIKNNYQNINFVFSLGRPVHKEILNQYCVHPELTFQNFLCSFNGSPHVGRKLLVSALNKFNYYNPKYCSKNFSFSVDVLDGHIFDYVGDAINFYRKFFIGDRSEEFFQTVNSFGHVRFNHTRNIYNLEHKLTESFLHVVSETLATSYYPFVTEKFLYSVVTRGLFLACAQPGWHAHLERYYGFRGYTRLFDYRFDTIENPVERLVELMSMISKFSVLSADDWRDLYELESETIEYNYDHYFSGNYLTCLKQHQ